MGGCRNGISKSIIRPSDDPCRVAWCRPLLTVVAGRQRAAAGAFEPLSRFAPEPAHPMSRPPGKSQFAPLPSHTRGIADALAHSEPLALLTRRMHESQARLAAIAPLLPPTMRVQVKAGPIDEAGWTLLVGNSAVSAKLRQMVPALEAHLRSRGWDGPPVRVKLLNPG